MGFFSKKTPFADLDQESQTRFVNDVAELFLDSFNRWGRFPPGPESLLAIKLRARSHDCKLTLAEVSAVQGAALQIAMEWRRTR